VIVPQVKRKCHEISIRFHANHWIGFAS
jgi:hypothetical protein